MNKILVEVSVGELLDKISILEIKKEKISDASSLKIINTEYSILKEKQGKDDAARELIMKAYDLYKNGDKELELTQKILSRFEKYQEQLP